MPGRAGKVKGGKQRVDKKEKKEKSKCLSGNQFLDCLHCAVVCCV